MWVISIFLKLIIRASSIFYLQILLFMKNALTFDMELTKVAHDKINVT